MIRTRLAALFLSAAMATLPAEPVPQFTLTVDSLPGEIQPYGDHTESEETLLLLTSCMLLEGAEEPKDITEDFADKASFGIPEQAKRGYVFEIRPKEGAGITAVDLVASLERYLGSGACPERLTRLIYSVPGNVESLGEAGFSSEEEARAAGFTEFYVDVDGFWGLEAGWRSVNDRTRLRDRAIPDSLDEMYVTPGYLYRQYLQTGGRFEKLQPEFLGIALSRSVRSGILTENDRVLLVFPVPTTVSVVTADLRDARLLRAEGDYVGPYVIEGRDSETIRLQENTRWWGDSPCDAPVILCRAGEK